MKALPSTFVLSTIVFSMLVFGGLTIFSEINNVQSSFLDSEKYPEFNASFNKLADVNESVGGLRAGIGSTSPDWGFFGVLNALYNGAWNTLKGLFTSMAFMNDVWNGLTTVFGVHPYFAWMISLIVTTLIAFGIYSAIFQREI